MLSLKLKKNEKWWIVAIILIVLTWTVIFFSGNGIRECKINSKGDSFTYCLTDNSQISQSFVIPSDNLEGLILYAKATEWRAGSALKISFFDEADALVQTWNFGGDEIAANVISNDERRISLPFNEPYNTVPESMYRIVIETENVISEDNWQFKCSSSDASKGDFLLDGEILPCDLTLAASVEYFSFIWKFYLFIIALFFITSFIIYFLLGKEKRFEVTATVLAFSLGIIYNFMVPVFSVPDESIHFASSYKLTNQWLGEQLTDDWNCVLMRKQDVYRTNVQYSSISQFWKYYATEPDYGDDMNTKAGWGVGKALDGTQISYYLPAVAILTARLLQFKSLALLMFGRLPNLLLYCAALYFALKLAPIGKKQIAVVAMFPMSLSLAASYSYDCMTIAGNMLFIALLLRISLQEKKTDWKDIIALLLISLTFIPIKVVYGTVLLPLLFLPDNRFKNKMQLFVAKAGIILANVVVILFSSRMLRVVGQNISGEKNTYSIWEALRNPFQIFVIMAQNFISRVNFYLENAVGAQMGWFNIYIFRYIIYGFIVLMLLSSARPGDHHAPVGRQLRIPLLLSSIGGCVAIFLTGTLLFGHHAGQKDSVAGVQGRYFLPLILPLPIIFRMNCFSKEIKENDVIRWECLLHLFTFLCMLNHYLITPSTAM